MALSEELGVLHLDSDAYGWEQTDPPFVERRPIAKRVALLHQAIESSESWVLSGSLWSKEIICTFPITLVVFLYLDTSERIQRLRTRELERYGNDVLPGGSRFEHSQQFLNWAASYDDGPMGERSLALHRSWLDNIPFPHVSLQGNQSVSELVQKVIHHAYT
jgi:hypothetical protein